MSKRSKVCALLGDHQGCGYYRIKLPFGELQKHGYDIDIADRVSIGAEPATIIGQRMCTTKPTITWQRFAKDENYRLVYELDDDLINIDQSNESAYYFFTHPEIAENIVDNIRVADLVTVTNAHLADLVREYNNNVAILPNYIDESLLTLPKIPIQVGEEDLSKYVTVGYTGSPTHQKDFAMIEDQLTLFAENHPQVLYVWMGAQYYLTVPQIAIGWFADIFDYYQHLNFDIGIAPLSNNIFNYSKSYIKALEYAAAGIPIVASDIGPYREFVKHGETGFLAKQPYHFSRYLRELVNNVEMRKEMGRNARNYATQFTIQNHWHEWVDALELVK